MTGVVIPYYNGREWIEKCIDSVLQSDTLPDRIYIVDNDRDGLALPGLESNHRIHVLRARPGIGFARACNIGISRAQKEGVDYIILLNQDTTMHPKMIGSLLDAVNRHDEMTIAVPMIHDLESGELSPHFIKRTLQTTTYFADLDKQNVPQSYNIRVASAACIALRTSVFDKTGLFDPLFPMYGEDDDLFRRLFNAGGKVILVTSARLNHYHTLSRELPKRGSEVRRQVTSSGDKIFIRYRAKNKTDYCLYHLKRIVYLQRKLRLSDAAADFAIAIAHLGRWRELREFDTSGINERAKKFIAHDSL